MQRLTLLAKTLLLTLFIALSFGVLSAQDSNGSALDRLNVRTGPGTSNPAVARLAVGDRVFIEGRNQIGNWIRIRTPDGSAQGWVAAQFVRFDPEVALDTLPILTGNSASTTPNNDPAPQTNAQPSAAPQNAAQPQAQMPSGLPGAGMGRVTVLLNVRTGPGTQHGVITQARSGSEVNIEGRNGAGDWLLISAGDLRGWVAARYVDFTMSTLEIPIVNPETGEITQPDNAPLVGGVTTDPEAQAQQQGGSGLVLPQASTDELFARLNNTPILFNMTSGAVYQINARGRSLGNNPRAFMKVGDSVTAEQPFLTGYGQGGYNLGAYANLQATIDFFNVSPMEGVPNSWVRRSFAAQSGFTSAAVFDGLWVPPDICDEAPLYCEYNLMKPSVAIILLGPVDLRSTDAYTFQANIYGVLQALSERGVIPVLTTFPSHPDVRELDAVYFNNIVLNAAADYNTPVINLWRATRGMPDFGVNLQDPIHMTQPTCCFYNFTGEESSYGVSIRNLLTLQALDTLRVNVLQ